MGLEAGRQENLFTFTTQSLQKAMKSCQCSGFSLYENQPDSDPEMQDDKSVLV